MAAIPNQIQGLSRSDVQERLDKGMKNYYQSRPSRTYIKIIVENIFSFYNVILMVAVTILIFLKGTHDVLTTTFLLLINIAIGLIQEVRAKYMVDKLSLLSPRIVTVRRDGKNCDILGEDIVQDDVIVLKPGEPVIVDGPVLESEGLEIDESSLTGESQYIAKNSNDKLLSGSYCVAGSGLMKAEKIGKESYISVFKKSVQTYKFNRTPFEHRLTKLLRLILITLAVFGPLTLVAGMNVQLPISSSIENMANLLIILLPQGIITSVSILFALGAIQISKSHAIVQRMNAIESMGHVKVLCTDKTGTLTKNILRLYKIIPFDESLESVQEKLNIFAHNVAAPNQIISALLHSFPSPPKKYKKITEVPFTSEHKWSSITFAKLGTFILGSPELLFKDQEQRDLATQYSTQGLRVVAFTLSQKTQLSQHADLPATATPLGLIIFSDEVRPEVSKTIKDFTRLGIQVKIISGDNAETVHAIAVQAGVKSNTPLTQAELTTMNNHEFDKATRNATIFARIDPEMKRKIILSLTKQGMYVAMVGDGVNDVLALKKARVSIAMNSGAQITKDISDIILLNNAFSTLPKAIEEGREIIERIYAVAKIFFVKITYLMILLLLVGFANLPFPINLRQTTLLGFIITGIPIFLITFKFLHPAKQQNPSKDFIKYTLLAGGIGGLAMTYITVITITFLKQDIALSQTLVTLFAALYSNVILSNIAGISLFDIHSLQRHKQPAMNIALLGVISIVLPAYFFPEVFDLVRLQLYHWLLLGGLTLACAYALYVLHGKLSLRKI